MAVETDGEVFIVTLPDDFHGTIGELCLLIEQASEK